MSLYLAGLVVTFVRKVEGSDYSEVRLQDFEAMESVVLVIRDASPFVLGAKVLASIEEA